MRRLGARPGHGEGSLARSRRAGAGRWRATGLRLGRRWRTFFAKGKDGGRRDGLYIDPSLGFMRGRSESGGGGAHGFAALSRAGALRTAGSGVGVEVGVGEWTGVYSFTCGYAPMASCTMEESVFFSWRRWRGGYGGG